MAFFGAGSKVAWAGSGGAPGLESSNPITSNADGLEWYAAVNGTFGMAWIQKSGLNSGNPYRVYSGVDDNRFWSMAAVWAGNDSTNSSSGNGFFRWAPADSPSNTSGNDWGTATHVFNDTFDFNGYNGADRSARTRVWSEVSSEETRLFFKNQSQTSALIYTMTSNETWGGRMITKGPSSYFDNGSAVSTVRTASITSSVSGTVNDVRWYNLGLGASDGEATNVNSNDVIMIVANGRTSGTPATDWNETTGFSGVGVKRSQVSNGYPASYTFNGTGGDSKAGVIAASGVYNGVISFDTDGYIICYVTPF